mgnify:CR=1 FL=1
MGGDWDEDEETVPLGEGGEIFSNKTKQMRAKHKKKRNKKQEKGTNEKTLDQPSGITGSSLQIKRLKSHQAQGSGGGGSCPPCPPPLFSLLSSQLLYLFVYNPLEGKKSCYKLHKPQR